MRPTEKVQAPLQIQAQIFNLNDFSRRVPQVRLFELGRP